MRFAFIALDGIASAASSATSSPPCLVWQQIVAFHSVGPQVQPVMAVLMLALAIMPKLSAYLADWWRAAPTWPLDEAQVTEPAAGERG